MKHAMMMRILLGACLLTAATTSATATEYFVSTVGDDAHDGRSRISAFASVQRGVDALAPGDTLIILPGEYFGPVTRANLGRVTFGTQEHEAVQTTIRADIAGTVTLRGDIDAPAFTPVDGEPFVFVAEVDGKIDVQSVNELDTLAVLRRVLSRAELVFNPGSFYQDRDANRLYVSTSDLQPIDQHAYSLSVTPAHGIYLVRPYRVVIDGLAVTGFDNAVQVPHQERTHRATFGIFIVEGNDCVIRNCLAYFNGRGIGANAMKTGGGNIIEHCTVWANRGVGGGGALSLFDPINDELRDSVAFHNGRFGVVAYADGISGRIERVLAWDNESDFHIKAHHDVVVNQSIGVGEWSSAASARTVTRSLIGHIREQGQTHRNNIVLSEHPGLDLDATFADPANHDYRLQSTARFRGAGQEGGDLGPFAYEPTVHFVSTKGDDAADGLSLRGAWRSLDHALSQLSGGDTLYIAPGHYTIDTPWRLDRHKGAMRIAGRGHGPVVIDGMLRIESGAEVTFERLTFARPVEIADGRTAHFSNCTFLGETTGLAARRVESLDIEHCVFFGFSHAGLQLKHAARGTLRGNAFNNVTAPAVRSDDMSTIVYSDYNGYASADHGDLAHHDRYSISGELQFRDVDGIPMLVRDARLATSGPHRTAIGHHNPVTAYKSSAVRLLGPRVHSVTATTANLEWWTSRRVGLTVTWGKEGQAGRVESIDADRAGSLSLTGLDPDTSYFFELRADAPIQAQHSTAGLAEHDDGVTVQFRTARVDPPPRTYYVATHGDDGNTGLDREQAWQTINHAADRVRPGDTVQIAGGTYHESVRIRASGDAGRPITFTPVPGEKVVFDGHERTLTHAFYVADKCHINIDGFYFTDLGQGGVTPWGDGRNGGIVLYRARNINITRCYLDGSGAGPYSPGLLEARHCSDVLVKNCVIFSAMNGGIGFAATPNMRIENSVFFRNFIGHISEAINTPEQTFIIRNNIFTDNLPNKVNTSLMDIDCVEAMVEDNNVFHLRLPIEVRRMIQLYDKLAFERAASANKVGFASDRAYLVKEVSELTFPEYRARYNPKSTSFAADPAFVGNRFLELDSTSQTAGYLVDQLRNKLSQPDGPAHDFNLLFATNPALLERDIGLQRSAFEDHHAGRR